LQRHLLLVVLTSPVQVVKSTVLAWSCPYRV
jgi:hypothetical protein